MPKYQAVRGTKDILPADSAQFQKLESAARALFARYGYAEIRTPTFEAVDLFQRSLGETTDVVQKEMYVFEDRGGRKLALRPEGTAGVVRAFIEHHLSQSSPYCKLFYVGPMFRAERPQAGRYREFWQLGAEYFGNAGPAADAELLALVEALLLGLAIPDVRLRINSLGDQECRPKYLAALRSYLAKRSAELCEDCQGRIDKNPLRALDCKTDAPKLKDAPAIDAYWCAPCRTHFTAVTQLLTDSHVSFETAPRLVRGLDYYTRTIFEVTTKALGAQDALAAGGRYDKLVKELDGPDVPALGFAMGMERAIQAMDKVPGTLKFKVPGTLKVFVAAVGEAASRVAYQMLQMLRHSPELAKINLVAEGGFFEKKLGAQLTIADRVAATHCVILGEDEVQKGEVTLRTMNTSSQERLAQKDLVSKLLAVSHLA
jgi:histidyl-tRNA synthetase